MSDDQREDGQTSNTAEILHPAALQWCIYGGGAVHGVGHLPPLTRVSYMLNVVFLHD